MAGEFAAERPAGLRYRSVAAGAVLQVRRRSTANAGSVALRADEGGSIQTCVHYVNRKLVTVTGMLLQSTVDK